jgi:hypothetical protein
MWLLEKRAELSRDRLSSNKDQGEVGVQRYSSVQCLNLEVRARLVKDHDEDEV